MVDSRAMSQGPRAAYANGDPDAILAGNDQMGTAGMKLMAAQGRRVPSDVIITGISPTWC
jgi:DNA-binding LacI/PurR family transcriptional regulator